MPPFIEVVPAEDKLSLSWMANEIPAYEAVTQIIARAKYTGCSSKTPENLQIRNFPSLVYAFVLYYKRSSLSDRDKRLFEEYKTEDVGAHVTTKELRCQIQNYAKCMPSPDLVSLIPMIKILLVDRVELLLAKRTPAEKETLLATIARDADRGS